MLWDWFRNSLESVLLQHFIDFWIYLGIPLYISLTIWQRNLLLTQWYSIYFYFFLLCTNSNHCQYVNVSPTSLRPLVMTIIGPLLPATVNMLSLPLCPDRNCSMFCEVWDEIILPSVYVISIFIYHIISEKKKANSARHHIPLS